MSRLGRNPFEKKPLRAADIVREMNDAAEKTEQFKKASPQQPEPKSFVERAAHFVLVDLRAKSYLLGIKAYCLSISLMDRA